VYKKIVTWPNRSLFKECAPIKFTDSYFAKLDDLVDTFRVIQGYGLAAPQIGYHLRAFVINPQMLGIEGFDGEYMEIINPTIECSGEEFVANEACFSVPEVGARVKRYENCEVKFSDRNGSQHTLRTVGFPSACLQHEYDHLEGILFLGRVSSLKRSMLTRKISKIRKRKAQAAKLAREQFQEDSMLYQDESPSRKKAPSTKKRKKRVKRKKQQKRKRK